MRFTRVPWRRFVVYFWQQALPQSDGQASQEQLEQLQPPVSVVTQLERERPTAAMPRRKNVFIIWWSGYFVVGDQEGGVDNSFNGFRQGWSRAKFAE